MLYLDLKKQDLIQNSASTEGIKLPYLSAVQLDWGSIGWEIWSYLCDCLFVGTNQLDIEN